MSSRSRRLLPLVPLAVLVLVAACGSAEPSTGTPTPQASPVASGPGVSGDPSAPGSSPAAATQTDTEWGRIWDGIPAGFPRFPGSVVADPISPDPVSATYAVANDDTAEIAGWMQSSLELATFSTESLSGPLEDGSFVLESVGDGDCRIQTSVQPMGGLTCVIIRYGAACPTG